jgi:protein PhnA
MAHHFLLGNLERKSRTRKIMSYLPNCPHCNSAYTYEVGTLLTCPECAHEWSASVATVSDAARVWKDANGNLLQDGDTVTIIKDLKVKGASSPLKGGTKVKNIRLIEGDQVGVRQESLTPIAHTSACCLPETVHSLSCATKNGSTQS